MALAFLLVAWTLLGAWQVAKAPFWSGTDESIEYVAFAAAENRWATTADFERWHVEHFYYGPLYYLLFAPLPADPAYLDGFPRGARVHPQFAIAGGRVIVDPGYLARVPRALDRLYRAARAAGVACGALVLALLVLAARRVAHRARNLVALGAALPFVLLPQFLYYQALCNNDALLNALAAAAAGAFVAAVHAARRHDLRALDRAASAVAVLVGLALMTKASALALLPLVAGTVLVAARRGRLAITAARMAALTLAAGGWWLLHGLAVGDVVGRRAHRLAHPWAFVEAPLWSSWGWPALLATIARTFFGAFLGGVYGIPDAVFVAALTLAALLALLVAARLRRSLSPLRRVLAWTLVATCATNLVLVVANCRDTIAPYGRLLFPSLVPAGVLLALALAGLRPTRGRLSFGAGAALALGTLAAWTWVHRVVPAVRQAPERLVPLAALDARSVELRVPAWRLPVQQTLWLPAGRLRALRVRVERSALPILGGGVGGTLTAGRRSAALGPARAEYAPEAWLELALAEPLDVAEGPARLELHAQAPWLAATEIHYVLTTPTAAAAAAQIAGQRTEHSLALAAVYE